jgi:non-specific serine/threonine protein kinase/serine/threonine-protein kinase
MVLMALRKEPERRYASAEQFAEDLKRYLDGLPVLAAPDSALYRVRKFIARNRVAAAAAAGFILAVAIGVIASMWQARVAREERNRAQREFAAVKSLATSVLGELHDAVAPLPGSLAARELLIRRGTEYLETLSTNAADDASLRRELAQGYRRLAQIQGDGGMPNLGDRQAARRSLMQAASLFESLPAPLDVESGVGLAETYIALHRSRADRNVDSEYRSKAEALLNTFLAGAPENARVQATASSLWYAIGNEQEGRKEFAAGLGSFQKMKEAAQAWVTLAPESMDASRALSIAHKKMGTAHELLDRHDEAIAVYEKAVEIDRARVARDPTRGLWRLDLSFAYAAIGSALAAKGRTELALERYRDAVALRREAVEAEPQDDFARSSLARGYERVGLMLARLGNIDGALAAEEARVAVLSERRLAHPDRDGTWMDEAAALFSASRRLTDLLEAQPNVARPAHLRAVRGMLDRLSRLRFEWRQTKRAGSLPPPDDQLRELVARANRLK